MPPGPGQRGPRHFRQLQQPTPSAPMSVSKAQSPPPSCPLLAHVPVPRKPKPSGPRPLPAAPSRAFTAGFQPGPLQKPPRPCSRPPGPPRLVNNPISPRTASLPGSGCPFLSRQLAPPLGWDPLIGSPLASEPGGPRTHSSSVNIQSHGGPAGLVALMAFHHLHTPRGRGVLHPWVSPESRVNCPAHTSTRLSTKPHSRHWASTSPPGSVPGHLTTHTPIPSAAGSAWALHLTWSTSKACRSSP